MNKKNAHTRSHTHTRVYVSN